MRSEELADTNMCSSTVTSHDHNNNGAKRVIQSIASGVEEKLSQVVINGCWLSLDLEHSAHVEQDIHPHTIITAGELSPPGTVEMHQSICG